MDRNAIVTLRKERLKWSQGQLADYLGINKATVSRIEAGILPPSGPVERLLKQLADKQPTDASAATN